MVSALSCRDEEAWLEAVETVSEATEDEKLALMLVAWVNRFSPCQRPAAQRRLKTDETHRTNSFASKLQERQESQSGRKYVSRP